jgi:hypothetical protein
MIRGKFKLFKIPRETSIDFADSDIVRQNFVRTESGRYSKKCKINIYYHIELVNSWLLNT